MALPYTAAQCQTVINALLAALANPGIKSISDPLGGNIQFASAGEIAAALNTWISLYGQASTAEQSGGRQAIAIERRRAI